MTAALAGAAPVSFRLSVLPWSAWTEDERRFRRILHRVLGAVLLLGVVLPFVPLRQTSRSDVQPLPPPMARLLLEPPMAPPPPAAGERARPTGQPAPPAERPTPPAAAEPRAPLPEARRPVAGQPPGERALSDARRRASGVGLLALKNELAEMSGAPLAMQLGRAIASGPGVGSGSGPGVGAGSEAGLPVRALINALATRGSGGIDAAAYSRDSGGGGLAGRATTLVEGAAGGGGGGGPGGGGSRAGGGSGGAGGTLAKGVSGKASRSIEEIKLVFERHKGAIYALYNRALRADPALQGKVVLELKIAPSGQVEDLRIVSSELKAEELERKLLARIRQFDFGAKDVAQMVVTWPVDFLPS